MAHHGDRPADAARRALRAARGDRRSAEQPETEAAPTTGHARTDAPEVTPTPASDEPARAEVAAPAPELPTRRHPGEGPRRPADIAREALRRARAEEDAVRDSDLKGDTPSPEEREREREVDPRGATHPRPAAPPAPDRDADADAGVQPSPPDEPATRPADLAREALRSARAEARREAPDPGASRGPASRRRRAEPARVPGGRAGDVRRLLADAFRMPSDDDDAGEEPTPSHVNAPGWGAWQEEPPASAPDSRTPPDPERHHEAPPAAPPRTAPGSMAAPGRDGDLRRTFPAFPPRTPAQAGPDGRPGEEGSAPAPFADTWWGNAWITALEEGALDVKRLLRGRGYAEQGHVDAITVTPGSVLAYVQGSRPRPYRVQVRLRTLGEEGWERFLEAAVERPGHIAALLDKELPHSLADCGVPLLPEAGDLEPQCSCPDRGHPCKHAAALCYQTARLLDADPFVLLLLRGRGERELLDALSRRNAARAARAAQEHGPDPLPGVRASEALAPERRLSPLPPPLPLPPHPEQPPAYPSVPDGPDSFALDQLATDAAARAHALLATGRDEVGELTLWQDAVRLAAARPGSGLTAGSRALYSSLASAAGRTPAELARAVAAWRQGGPDGLAVLEEPWDPPAGRFDRARPLLLAADLPAFRPWRNRLTHPRGHIQLRLGHDGLWYAYESEPDQDDWWPRGTPDPDPVGALTGLATDPDTL
ncbi:SWIM zinc finger family protein [Streptomyces longwoodensis]|uniref:SWIM zinc finger family protein n=1 Tax=Streptomyces longwoodensis TaxID=68231 RepID=UPI0033EBFF9A